MQIVSGGQSGVDSAALEVALELGIPTGGWCPRGCKREDGRVPARYGLQQTPSRGYAQRTRWNVRDSDGTLLLLLGEAKGGTALTLAEAEKHGKPLLALDLSAPLDKAAFLAWMHEHGISHLNVAGPRESQQPGVNLKAAQALRALLSA
ncbi:MAG: putative molybdenum carrier protein [SAR324 cluster bacterium]|nr:putative molybdenum carrier protein [SAR324 cluster bacterium]